MNTTTHTEIERLKTENQRLWTERLMSQKLITELVDILRPVNFINQVDIDIVSWRSRKSKALQQAWDAIKINDVQ